MQIKVAFAAGLFALAASISFNAGAAADTPPAAKSVADNPARAEADGPAHQMMMGPHSHAEEKTGFPQRAPQAQPNKPNPARDFSKHFHPRDGK